MFKFVVFGVLALLCVMFIAPTIGERCPKCGSRHTRKFKDAKGNKKYICDECLEIWSEYGE